MSRVKSFDPGALESIELRMWVVQGSRQWDGGPVIKARATGSYRVYCGGGWEHGTDIDQWWLFSPDRPRREVEQRFAAAWRGDSDAAGDAAHQLVEWALEDWTDPCSDVADDW